MEILIISYSARYDGFAAAGEKTHNFYMKALAAEPDINVRLISFCHQKDSEKLDLDSYSIKNTVFVYPERKVETFIWTVARAVSFVLKPRDKYAHFVNGWMKRSIREALMKWKEECYKPDCIILEWTHMILLVDMIRSFFPYSKVIASVHDVNYVGSKRCWDYEKNILIKQIRKQQYLNLKKREITALSKCDLIMPHNLNDVNLLNLEDKLRKKDFFRIVPYYDDYSNVRRDNLQNTILFYGAMGRRENYLSVQWFIENVFIRLQGYRFVIIGGGVMDNIKQYESENIHITGYLPEDKVKEEFSHCKCMVVPLVLGSGIKVKILEAFSAGIPVLTNHIGMEGIFAEPGVHYIYCETADEYVASLNQIRDGQINILAIGEAARNFVTEEHSLQDSKRKYIEKVKSYCVNDK